MSTHQPFLPFSTDTKGDTTTPQLELQSQEDQDSDPETITVQAFAEHGLPDGKAAYLETAWGPERVGSILWPEDNPWAHCPDSNAGHGISYAVSQTRLLTVREEA